jgi:predicted nucleic acid-binding protein
MKIVIDSNIIIADFWMESTNFKLLFESAKKGNVQILIPEIVLDEVINKYRQRLEKSLKDVGSELRTFNKLSKGTIKQPIEQKTIDKSIKDYQKHLRKTVKKNEIIVLKYPKTEHKYLAKKAMLKLKPFNTNEKGYRDNLIWENIKELLTDYESVSALPELVFISNNYKDFTENEYELHPDLISELEDEDFDTKSVIVYPSLGEFNDKQVKLFFAQSKSFEKKLKNEEIWDFDLRTEVNEYLYQNFVGSELFYFYDNFAMEYSEPTVSGILDEEYEIKITSVKKLNAKDYLVDITFDVESEIDFFIDRHDFYSMDVKDGISITDPDWNKHVMLASTSFFVPLSMSLIIDTDMNVKSIQISKVNTNYAQQYI